LAAYLSLTRKAMLYWSHRAGTADVYRQFSIPKRIDGDRLITAPVGQLGSIQRKLLQLLSSEFQPRKMVHGFVRERSIVSNARIHTSRKYVLNVDLKDFFGSINFGRILGALTSNPFRVPHSVATLIARFCCHDNALPQGAPTSPILSNYICLRLDAEMMRLARSLGCRYTRYADDLTISTSKHEFPVELASLIEPYGTHATAGQALKAVIESNGFTINELKVRLYHRCQAQRVTGLTVNKFPNVHRRFVRQIRAMIYAWEKFGHDKAQAEYHAKYQKRSRHPNFEPPSFARVLHGKLTFLAMVRGLSDPIYIKFTQRCHALNPDLFKRVFDKEDNLNSAVWVLESESAMTQGTGFFLKDVGMVTCAHVLATDTVAFHASQPLTRFPVKVLTQNDHLDIAVVQVDILPRAALQMGDPTALTHNSRILVAGYPNYGEGDPLYKGWGTVTTKKVRHGVLYLIPSAPIAAGNSGGPVVDEQYRVIGIAARGVKNLADASEYVDALFGIISIRHLSEMLGNKQLGLI
jgi:S1-C subfamily serine protease